MKTILSTLFILFVGQISFGQCPGGQSEVTMIVSTDDYGYEGYWEILPTGSPCGTGTIASGGNTAVGCNGAGNQAQTPGGYGNNVSVNEGPWCLTTGSCFDLFFADDWGDGGFTFEIFVNGFQIETFDGIGLGGTYTFCVQEPPAYDLSVFGSNLYSYVNIGAFDLDAKVFNNGTTTINSYDLNYMIDGGAVVTHNVTGSTLANYQEETISHSIPVNIATNGVYQIKIWADNFNSGNVDAYNPNDTLTKYIEAGPGIPNYIDGYVGNTITINQVAGSAEQVNSPTDLDFHPVLTNKELWVCNKGTENSGGSTVTIYDAGEVSQTSEYKQDGNAWHFMSLPTGIAFSQNGNWANSPGVYDANHDGGGAFTGPSLWSSDMTIYAEPSGGNGSHLDMLHLSPYSQGVASEVDNVFWIFDGFTNDIVRYDFVEDHGPGNSFHGDAIVRRFSDEAVAKDPNDVIVSHLVLDEAKQWLYVVDHGNQRVFRMDINTGADLGGAPNYAQNEPIAEYSEITGYTQETMVSGLDKPAGIDVVGNRMIVSEFESGEIIIYDISVVPAVELDRLNTGFTSVQGIKIGPEGRIWFVDQNTNGVYNIDANELSVSELPITFNVYPNPTAGKLNVFVSNSINGLVEVRDIQGKLVHQEPINGQAISLNLEAKSGMYFVSLVKDNARSQTQRIVVK